MALLDSRVFLKSSLWLTVLFQKVFFIQAWAEKGSSNIQQNANFPYAFISIVYF